MFGASRKDRPQRHLPDATPLLGARAQQNLWINAPWHERQGELMLEQAVADRRITREQADSADYLYIQQPDGSMFCAVAILNTPGLVLGTSLPADGWKKR